MVETNSFTFVNKHSLCGQHVWAIVRAQRQEVGGANVSCDARTAGVCSAGGLHRSEHCRSSCCTHGGRLTRPHCRGTWVNSRRGVAGTGCLDVCFVHGPHQLQYESWEARCMYTARGWKQFAKPAGAIARCSSACRASRARDLSLLLTASTLDEALLLLLLLDSRAVAWRAGNHRSSNVRTQCLRWRHCVMVSTNRALFCGQSRLPRHVTKDTLEVCVEGKHDAECHPVGALSGVCD
jgi:hypothetical protein